MSSDRFDHLQIQTLDRVSRILASFVKNKTFGMSVRKLIEAEHRSVLADLSPLTGPGSPCFGNPVLCKPLEKAVGTLTALTQAVSRLSDESQIHWGVNGHSIRNILDEFHDTLRHARQLVIEKDLLDRQSRVLSRIILSSEKVARWKEFIRGILRELQEMFPFEVFSIAFTEDQSLTLYLYYRSTPQRDSQERFREYFLEYFRDRFGLSRETSVEVEEFFLSEEPDGFPGFDLKTLMVTVPDYAADLSGILGIAYGVTRELTPQEQSVIQSILSVMVMVIGSIKVISRTLSELEYYSTHDPLTGLHNRRYFNEMIGYEIQRSERHGHKFCLLMIDLDNFKDVNDSYGHLDGDRVLNQLGKIVTGTVRKGDIVCRFGGDEFVVLLSETSLSGGCTLAETVREAIQTWSFGTTDRGSFHVTVSVGIVAYPQDGNQIEDLLAGLDLVLYRAKERGRNTVASSRDLRTDIRSVRLFRLHTEEFRQALGEERIVPYFHGIYAAGSGRLLGYESLARLLNTDGTVVQAQDFLDLARKYGLLTTLDRFMLEKSLRTVAHHPDFSVFENGIPVLFVNLSSQEIENHGFLDLARELCDRFGVAPSRLVFEIVESDAIQDLKSMKVFLQELRSKGFSFALDDFGSGYNSFHYLRELHFEYVKIDGAFVRNIVHSPIDRALVGNLIRLCREIGTKTIAEYVEGPEIHAILREMSVDFVQGYHFGLPGPLSGY
uniref:Diguanylate cyclase/phosphodiesterase n=1 Tax=Leptospirillum sp. Group II '5-way CG' TaxID=419541 RepID=B6AS70_9BACT|nr:MAG: Diguanylate cyclase/phosphodiesterase [Leptospirillum sp. Group II '5-way CG']